MDRLSAPRPFGSILKNQNELPGYIAEAQLSLDIINWFTEVLQTLWLGWLRHEIAGWIDYPHRVRLVQLILKNQNELPR